MTLPHIEPHAVLPGAAVGLALALSYYGYRAASAPLPTVSLVPSAQPAPNVLNIRNFGTVYNVQGRSLLSAKEAKETMERVKKGIDDL